MRLQSQLWMQSAARNNHRQMSPSTVYLYRDYFHTSYKMKIRLTLFQLVRQNASRFQDKVAAQEGAAQRFRIA